MKPEIAQEWVAALRSGKYTQAKGTLVACGPNEKHCCLGVLCELAVQKGVVNRRNNEFDVGYDEAVSHLPWSVMEWAGTTSITGRLNEYSSLAWLNDNGKTFEEIATIIEENVDRL